MLEHPYHKILYFTQDLGSGTPYQLDWNSVHYVTHLKNTHKNSFWIIQEFSSNSCAHIFSSMFSLVLYHSLSLSLLLSPPFSNCLFIPSSPLYCLSYLLCQTPDIGVIMYFFCPCSLESKVTYNFLVFNVGMKFTRFLIFPLSQLICCHDVCNFIFLYLYFYMVLMSEQIELNWISSMPYEICQIFCFLSTFSRFLLSHAVLS